MGKPSKENNITELFLNEPSKHWHFKEIVAKSGVSQDRANHWIKELLTENIIRRIKETGKMPYYLADFDNPKYKYKKKIAALETFYKSGFFTHLESLNANTVVLFGSFTRSDWHSESDIDLFIIGKDDNFEKGKFERILKREIQLFTCKNKKEAKKMNKYLINNIINGYFIKGCVENIVEV